MVDFRLRFYNSNIHRILISKETLVQQKKLQKPKLIRIGNIFYDSRQEKMRC